MSFFAFDIDVPLLISKDSTIHHVGKGNEINAGLLKVKPTILMFQNVH